MVVAWHCTENLVLDRDGILWRAVRTGDKKEGPVRWCRLGAIEDDPDVPEALGTELAECLDLWLDRVDDRAEQLWNFRRRG